MYERDHETGLFLPDRKIIRSRGVVHPRHARHGGMQQAMLGVAVVPAASDTAFITSVTPGSLRNNFTGGVGLRVAMSVGTTPNIVITQLGRWVVSGNSQTHVLRIRDNAGTDLGNVTISTSGAGVGAFVYAPLASPVTVNASTTGMFFVLSDETSGGDQWYDNNLTATYQSIAGTTVVSGYYDGAVHGVGSSTAFGPTSFKYSSP